LPRRDFGQQLFELGHALGFIGAGVRAVQELVQRLVVKALPGFGFVAPVDWASIVAAAGIVFMVL
jgi:hypothetical protein